MFALIDTKTIYTRNFKIYPGKQPDGPYSQNNLLGHVVNRLVCPAEKTSRNITANNWFSSILLALDL